MSFIFNEKGTKIVVEDAIDTMDDWVIIEQQTVSNRKYSSIIEVFERDFSNIKLLGVTVEEKFDYLVKLVSRSEKLNRWYVAQRNKFSEASRLPSFLEELVTPVEFTKMQEKIDTISNIVSEFENKREELNEEYDLKINKLRKETDDKVDSILAKDKMLRVMMLGTQNLPLSILNAIESYNPATSDNNFMEKKKLYAKELLTRFKIELLTKIKENPEIDIEGLLDSISLK